MGSTGLSAKRGNRPTATRSGADSPEDEYLIGFSPVDTAIAVRSVDLAGPLHDDPADRIVIATALWLGAALVTRDERIRRYPHVKTVW